MKLILFNSSADSKDDVAINPEKVTQVTKVDYFTTRIKTIDSMDSFWYGSGDVVVWHEMSEVIEMLREKTNE